MSEKEKEGATSRRDFLKLASVSAPAAVAATALATTEAEAETARTGEGGMRDTAHIRAYLDSARF